MAKKPVKKSESSPKTTRNGNKLFEGAKDGRPFVKGVPKTEAEKEAISKGMREASARRKMDALIYGEAIYLQYQRIKDGSISDKDLNDALSGAAKRLGDDISKQEIIGNLGVEKIFVTPEEMKKVDNHIDDVINDGFEL